MRQTSKRRASREGGGAKSSAPRTNLYDDVTRRIISELEAGRFPWVQPWGRPEGEGGTAAPGLPRNALTGRSYSGVNVLIFWGAVIEQARSEERRVGKECVSKGRFRGAPDH